MGVHSRRLRTSAFFPAGTKKGPGRPRKNRLGEYAQSFGEELQRLLGEELLGLIEAQHEAYQREIHDLRREVQNLSKQIEAMNRRAKAPKPKVGKWVPGGPGRPPKDASERIAAFESRTRTTDKKAR